MQACPRCTNQIPIKSGRVKERQRYQCKECSYYYTVSQKSDTVVVNTYNDKERVELWKARYDDYGRQIGRTDYNAGNKAQGIPSTHQHTKEFNAKFPDSRSTGDHLSGEYRP